LYFIAEKIIFTIMKAIINLYRRFYAIPEELPDKIVISRVLVMLIFFFILGFTISQVIIFLLK
jgi:hypothetical protein